ncbi:LysR family transcriptional regulator [Gemmata sp.]|uniref:LysR family transcriptional regulator n=1 Tax=Gemmata sp. TaxID=1914242 RepID=UPI003F7220B1
MKALRLDLFVNYIAAARAGSLSRAAVEAGLSRTALWQQLRGLERAYGATLFRRKRYGIELTAEGEQFLSLVEPLVAGFRALPAAFDALRHGRVPVLRVACPDSIEENELVPVLERFREEHPGARVEVVETPSRGVPGLIAAGEASLGLEVDPPAASAAGPLRYERLYDRRVFIAMRADHPLAAGRLTLRALAGVPFATEPTGSRLRSRLEQSFVTARLAEGLRVVFESSSERVLLGAVARGETVTAISCRRGPRAPGGVRVRAAGHLFGRLPVYLVSRPGRPPDRVASAFEAVLVRCLRTGSG